MLTTSLWWHSREEFHAQNSHSVQQHSQALSSPPPQNLEKLNSYGTSVQFTFPSECSFLLTGQCLLWEGYVGVKRSRKAYLSSWGHCREQWKSSWISGNVFSRSRDVLVCGRDSKAALLPGTFQIWLIAASANFIEGQFQYSGTQCPGISK